MVALFRRLFVVAVGIGAGWACNVGGVFECAQATECGTGDAICSDGHCAFPDPSCPSGYRYGQLAPASVAGSCTPPDAGGGTTTPGATATSSTSTGSGSSGGSTVGSSSEGTTGSMVDDTTDTQETTGATDTTDTTGWLEGDWIKRIPIVVNGSEVAGEVSNFTVLVTFTQNEALAADGAGMASLTFAMDDEPLDYEIERFDPSTGAIVAWVRLPSLDAGVDTTFHLYCGGDGGARFGDPWSGYSGVWHLSDGSDTQTPDASAHDNHGATIGPALLFEEGKIGDAVRFDGVQDGITVDPDSTLAPGPGLTQSAWVYADGFPVDAGLIVAMATTYGSGAGVNVYWMRTYEAWLEVVVKTPDTSASVWPGYDVTQLGSWHHVVGVHDGSTLTLYYDGVAVASSAAVTSFEADLHPVRIGSWGGGTSEGLETRTWDGLLDEVRITNVARSAAWIATEFNNQDSPGTFATPLAPEPRP